MCEDGSLDSIHRRLARKFGPEANLGAAQRAFDATAWRKFEFVTHMRNAGILLWDAAYEYDVSIQFLQSWAQEGFIPSFWKNDDRGFPILLYLEEVALEGAVVIYHLAKEQGKRPIDFLNQILRESEKGHDA
ncbi:MAG TPA: hypothetical protein VJC15_02535 [Candidatus Paceibacterota bacterium]